MAFKERLKTLFTRLLGGYEINRVYRSPTHGQASAPPAGLSLAPISSTWQVAESGCEEISKHAWYTTKPGYSYGAWEDGKLVCFCSYWVNADGNLPRRFKDTASDEIIMVDLITAGHARGKGYSVHLINYSLAELKALGYRESWTWIWHSNHPSIRAFEKAGWVYDHFLIELPWFGQKDRIRLKLPRLAGRLFG